MVDIRKNESIAIVNVQTIVDHRRVGQKPFNSLWKWPFLHEIDDFKHDFSLFYWNKINLTMASHTHALRKVKRIPITATLGRGKHWSEHEVSLMLDSPSWSNRVEKSHCRLCCRETSTLAWARWGVDQKQVQNPEESCQTYRLSSVSTKCLARQADSERNREIRIFNAVGPRFCIPKLRHKTQATIQALEPDQWLVVFHPFCYNCMHSGERILSTGV